MNLLDPKGERELDLLAGDDLKIFSFKTWIWIFMGLVLLAGIGVFFIIKDRYDLRVAMYTVPVVCLANVILYSIILVKETRPDQIYDEDKREDD